MIEIIQKLEQARHSHLVVLLKNRFDLEKYISYGINQKMISKAEDIFAKQKNTTLHFFLGRDDIEEVTFLFYLDVTQNIFDFVGPQIEKIGENIVFSYAQDNVLLDSIFLKKHEYQEYKTQKKDLQIFIECPDSQMKYLEERYSVLENINFCRDLVNKPSNDKTPDKYLQIIKNLKFKNVKIKVIEGEEVKRLGLGLLEAVGRASASKPKLILLEKISDKKLPTHAFVGKGITFDTGGLNIKTDDHMYGMKDDMAGSASVLWMMKNIDEQKLAVNVIGVLAVAENSIAGDAYRPGDILKSYSGKTVEITNTDAEGRLVLADAVSYVSKNYSLESITTIATLTGACMMALGYRYAGIMGNNQKSIDMLLQNTTHDQYWQLPLSTYHTEKTSGTISDLINYTGGVMAGSSMGGAFIAEFVMNKEKFTHIDIAGTAFFKEPYRVFGNGATGFGVESLSYLLQQYGKISER